MKESEILHGYGLAMVHRFTVPLLTLLTLMAMQMQLSVQWILDAFSYPNLALVQVYYFLAAMAWSTVNSLLITWRGFYEGLRARSFLHAFLRTAALMIGLPWLLVLSMQYWGLGYWYLAFFIPGLLISLHARIELQRRFRQYAATESAPSRSE